MRNLARALLLVGAILFVAGLIFSAALPQSMLGFVAHSNELASSNPLVFAVAFVSAFIAATTLGLPGGAVFSLSSGYFFGYVAGFMLALFSVVSSALCTRLIVRQSAVELVPQKLEQQLSGVRKFIQSDPVLTALLIRLIPILPFYLVNIGLSKAGISLKDYLITTILGLIPSTLALVGIGQSLQVALSADILSLSGLMTLPSFYLSAAALLVFAMMSFVLKQVRS